MVGRDAGLFKRADTLIGIQDTHYRFLAVIGRQNRDAEVDPATIKRRREAAVLRLSLFIKTHRRENFDSGNDC